MEKLYTPQEVSDYLSVSKATLCDWRVHGGGPAFIQQGRVVRYTASGIEQWMHDRIARRGD